MLSQTIAFAPQPDIRLEVIGAPYTQTTKSPWVFFAPHEDEHVINSYVGAQVSKRGGQLIILRQHGERLLQLDIDGRNVKIDPNRLFTKRGRIASINKLNPWLSPCSTIMPKALLRAKQIANMILGQLGGVNRATTWVALHNNSIGFKGDGVNGIGNVSTERYRQKLAGGANYLIQVTKQHGDQDDLFFVTQADDFIAMERASFNAVLQSPQVVSDVEEDDGSLSVFAQMQGQRYINVEAQRVTFGRGKDHLKAQQQMLDFVFTLLSAKPQTNKSH